MANSNTIFEALHYRYSDPRDADVSMYRLAINVLQDYIACLSVKEQTMFTKLYPLDRTLADTLQDHPTVKLAMSTYPRKYLDHSLEYYKNTDVNILCIWMNMELASTILTDIHTMLALNDKSQLSALNHAIDIWRTIIDVICVDPLMYNFYMDVIMTSDELEAAFDVDHNYCLAPIYPMISDDMIWSYDETTKHLTV